MSGIDTTEGSGGQRGTPPTASPCEKLLIETQLGSPKPAVVGLLKEGDVLEIGVQPLQGTIVVVAFHDGQVVGGVASTKLAQLRNCMEQGHEFVAKVLTISQGQVRVLVHPRQR